MPTQTAVAVVAEKPSVARDIARVLGAVGRGEGYLHGEGYVVTWAVGHLVTLAQPHQIQPEWRAWRRDLLPMLPDVWPLVVVEQTRDQFEVVRKIVNSPRISSIVCATDAGREGELIFRYIYEAAGCRKPVRRLWISSLTPEAIRDGFARLRDAREYDHLADAARGRSRADWLVGMNLSRAYTLACQEEISVGRVQTPTLAMLVERELAIRTFVPEDYRQVVATFSPRAGDTYKGTWFRGGGEPFETASRLPASGEEATAIVERVRQAPARIESVEAQTRRMAPPLLYDLTELQRHANRLYGFSAQRTLDLAQALYERHKLISYPRTDSRHLSGDVAATLPRIVRAIAAPYAAQLAPQTGERPLGRRYVDDARVTDHHAIIPTGVTATGPLDPAERKLFDLVCRRLLQAWHADHVWAVTTVITLSGESDRFHSTGSAVVESGWKALDIAAEGDEPMLPSGLAEGQPQQVLEVESVAKRTRPPKRLTDATLLTAMETAGKTLDDKELSDAMKESGLGTPATRAQIIEVLLKRGFIERRGKALEATDKGIRLIQVVHPEVKSPAMTGQWEAQLKRIERGQAALEPFLRGIEDYVREVVGKVGSAGAAPAASPPRAVPPAEEPAPSHPPVPLEDRSAPPAGDSATAPRELRAGAAPGGSGSVPPPAILADILHQRFGYQTFRPHQEEVCREVIAGRDVLLVMPTGSGKSLCYQLPGIALGGTTLVVSPLIALMEDQVAKLNAMGFAAERIHSGRDRASSREVCQRYLQGRLDFLFIAPERLRVQGFPEMLARRKPVLVAIDEAHCISQWGHDFRPDYRTIGRYLPALRPAPVIALTATATPVVQNDIALQLGLAAPATFIHGFRRDNLAIEIANVPASSRFSLVARILADPARRPAIVYVPTRRDSETLATRLEDDMAAAAYHAGLDPRRREEVQKSFLDGNLQVIVATIAFGMGIDKPDVRTVIHTALPGSVEGYYQEIGRAGRDGVRSHAVLMHAYADRFTHDFFFERDYPEPSVLARVFNLLTAEPQPKDAVRERAHLGPEEFDIAMEKLWIHGGANVDYAENLTVGASTWHESYLAQREYKEAQFEKVISYCEVSTCRMLALVRYFGDTADSNQRCGICDVCRPAAALAQTFRPPDDAERHHIARIAEVLGAHGAIATGRLYTQAYPAGEITRREFEEILGAMARGGMLELAEASFEKDGKRIDFRKARLLAAQPDPGDALFAKKIEGERRVRRRGKAGRTAKPTKKAARKTPPAAPPEEAPALELLPSPKAARKPRPAPPATPPAAGPPAALQPAPPSPGAASLEAALKAWRMAEARRKGIPAFRIFSDRTLEALARNQPRSMAEMLAIPGLGLKTIEMYGAQIFRILTGA